MTMPGEGLRKFTREDDEWIVRQSRGELPIKELRKKLRANMTTLDRRASELGVKLVLRLDTVRKPHPHPYTMYDDLTPARIRDDRLLKRLIAVHGEPNAFDG